MEDIKGDYKNIKLTYATRDGIIAHCGEIDGNEIKPRSELFALSDFDKPGKYEPATWEGCVVKIADKIAYLGRDIEDAIKLGYLRNHQIKEIAKVINEDNINTSAIISNMILDLCMNSSAKKGLCFSIEMKQKIDELKQYSNDNIYNNKKLNTYKKYIKLVINELFNELMRLYKGPNTIEYYYENKHKYKAFINRFMEWIVQYCNFDYKGIDWVRNISKKNKNIKIYGDLDSTQKYIKAVIDYISTMTDSDAINSFNELLQY